MRPDGFVRDETRKTKGTVYLFHGNHWHGYPEGHDKHNLVTQVLNTKTREYCDWDYLEKYNDTMEQHDIYAQAGYKVVFIWENEFNETQRKRFPTSINNIMHEIPAACAGTEFPVDSSTYDPIGLTDTVTASKCSSSSSSSSSSNSSSSSSSYRQTTLSWSTIPQAAGGGPAASVRDDGFSTEQIKDAIRASLGDATNYGSGTQKEVAKEEEEEEAH